MKNTETQRHREKRGQPPPAKRESQWKLDVTLREKGLTPFFSVSLCLCVLPCLDRSRPMRFEERTYLAYR